MVGIIFFVVYLLEGWSLIATAKEKDKEMRIGSIYIPSIGNMNKSVQAVSKSYANPPFWSSSCDTLCLS